MNDDAHRAARLEQPTAFAQKRVDGIRVLQVIDEMLGEDACRTPGG
jgi:hypothetical protein